MSMEQLVLENEALVHHTLKRFWRDDQYDEILAAGRMGLIKAARTYNSDRGKFSGHACRLIMQAAVAYRCKADIIRQPAARDWSDAPTVLSIDSQYSDDDTSDNSILNTLIADGPSPDSAITRADHLHAIRRCLKALSKPQRHACLRVLRGKPLSKAQRQLFTHMRRNTDRIPLQNLREVLHATA